MDYFWLKNQITWSFRHIKGKIWTIRLQCHW